MLNEDRNDVGLFKWQVGTILEKYEKDHYEVEFSDKEGIPIYIGAFSSHYLELIWSYKAEQYVGRFAKLLYVLNVTRNMIDSPETDVLWTKFNTVQELLVSFDSVIEDFKLGKVGTVDELRVLFAPTGDFQEISISSGWEDKFIEISREFENLINS